MGVLCLPETNVDWSNALHQNVNDTTFSQYQRSAKIVYSSQKPAERPKDHYLPDGTFTAALGPWVSRCCSTITDHGLGRWSGISFQGRRKTATAILTCYRVPQASLSSVGALTAIRRQAGVIASTTNAAIPTNPRQKCLDDLEIQITTLKQTNHEIILCMDANEPIHPRSALLPFLQRTGLHRITFPGPPLPSTVRGSTQIDHIFVSERVLKYIIRSGTLPFDSIYHSDHRPLYIDIDPRIVRFARDTPREGTPTSIDQS